MIITSKVIGEIGQNLVWHSFSIDALEWAKLQKKSEGDVKLMLIWYRMTHKLLHSKIVVKKDALNHYMHTHALGHTRYQTFQLQLRLQLLVVVGPHLFYSDGVFAMVIYSYT